MLFIIAVSISLFMVSNEETAKRFTPNLTGIKCVVSGKTVTRDCVAAYKKGNVYFDCNSSRLEFLQHQSKFTTKANHQLVVTGQYLQARCPFRQVAVAELDPVVSLAGVKIRFCCQGCQSKLSDLNSVEQQISFLFADERFKDVFSTNPAVLQAKKYPNSRLR